MMAEKRMFSKKIIDSDAFLDMPLSTQCLYFHLAMRADDEGFINNPKKISRMIGCGDDDLKLLVAKRFILPFESGVVVIKHWLIHNTIRKDRVKETLYKNEKSLLNIKENGAYTTSDIPPKIECQPNDNQMTTERQPNVSIDKNRLDKISLDKISLDINTYAPSDNIASEQTATEPCVISITLNDKSEYPIYQSLIDEWKTLYPNVDIEQQLRSMKGWCNANPTKRKTKRGILRFINAWLAREQDKPSFQKNNNVNKKGQAAHVLSNGVETNNPFIAMMDINDDTPTF